MTGGVVAVGLSAGVLAWTLISTTNTRRVHDQRVACERGNVLRGYLQIRAEENVQSGAFTKTGISGHVSEFLPLLDCAKGRPLDARTSRLYLREMRAGRVPHLEAGQVVSSEALNPPHSGI
jgi:hypothetical protein